MQEIFRISILMFLMATAQLLFCSKISNGQVSFKNASLYYFLLIITIILIIASNFQNSIIRLSIIFISWILCLKFLFNISFKKSIITVTIMQIYLFLLELIVTVILIGFLDVSSEILKENIILQLAPNIIVIILLLLSAKIPNLPKLCDFLVKLVDKVSIKLVFIIIFILMFSINIVMFLIYNQSDIFYLFSINIILIIVYAAISILMLKEKNTSEVYRIGYEEQQKALQDNVLLLDQECMKNHENVNQLYTIEGLARNNDTKGILEYIGVVIKEKKQEDNTLTRRIKRIPLATIQGLIYPKLGIMKDNDIDFQVVLARNIKEFDFTKIDMKTNMELCKILGVLIDNAIDEVTKLEDRKIKLELFCKNGDLHIDVSNNYGKLLDNMDEVGVTSKEGLHGYGLGIIAQITKQNPKLQNQKKINANRFHQIVVVSNSIDNKKKNV